MASRVRGINFRANVILVFVFCIMFLGANFAQTFCAQEEDNNLRVDKVLDKSKQLGISENTITNLLKAQEPIRKEFGLLRKVGYPTKAFFDAFIVTLIGCVFHEAGHAIAQKLVDPDSHSTIHINCLKFGKQDLKTLFKVGNIYIHDGLPLLHGSLCKCSRKSTVSEEVFISLAGGVNSSMFRYSVFLFKAFKQKYKETKNVKESLIWAIKNSLSPFENLLKTKGLNKTELFSELMFFSLISIVGTLELIYTFLPTVIGGDDADGSRVWNHILGRNSSSEFKLASMGLWGYLSFVIIKRAVKTYKTYIKDNIENYDICSTT